MPSTFTRRTLIAGSALIAAQFALGGTALALEGDKSMLVWLGKNYLDQTDQKRKPAEGDKPAEEPQKSEKAKVLEMAVIKRGERAKKAI